jgi:hypothetical protein
MPVIPMLQTFVLSSENLLSVEVAAVGVKGREQGTGNGERETEDGA